MKEKIGIFKTLGMILLINFFIAMFVACLAPWREGISYESLGELLKAFFILWLLIASPVSVAILAIFAGACLYKGIFAFCMVLRSLKTPMKISDGKEHGSGRAGNIFDR